MRQYFFKSALVICQPDRIIVRYKANAGEPVQLMIGGKPDDRSFLKSSPILMTVTAGGQPGVCPPLSKGGPDYLNGGYFEATFVGACTIENSGGGLLVLSNGAVALDDVEGSFPFSLEELQNASASSLLAARGMADDGPHWP